MEDTEVPDAERFRLGTDREWTTVRGQVSGLLLALRAEEVDTEVLLPVPLTRGMALDAWAAARRDPDWQALDLLGWAARTLGRSLCRWRATGVRDPIVDVLEREAAVHGCEPERLVAQVARAHGALSAPDPASAALVWHALDDPAPADL
ncbi:hypothetical protein EV188_1069 [Actinomycetospora succinea]|uniref:Uncharacterized protein n=1 Tax=Actinomycetospora succinea TaxID=663603 RepID=A0A4R6V524_9PSEU|nr:hypothetical protein [Actinomycetospora succinea]TDQ53865.1 hypothetical protein EV188_1069 [Actinomycetospora succinea]